MEREEVRIILVRADDDKPLRSAEYQAEVKQFEEALRSLGLKPSTRIQLLECVAGPGPATFLGDFGVALHSAMPVLTHIGTLLVGWLSAKSHRKVRIKIGDMQVDAQSRKDVEKLLDKIQEIKGLKKSRKTPKKKARKKP